MNKYRIPLDPHIINQGCPGLDCADVQADLSIPSLYTPSDIFLHNEFFISHSEKCFSTRLQES